jgi:hypothetical protein
MAKTLVVYLRAMSLVIESPFVVSVELIVIKACALLVAVPVINRNIDMDLDPYP